MKLQFDPFELDFDRAELRSMSGPVKLEPKAFKLLCLLAENSERVVSKEEMIAVVWNGRFISDAAVSTVLKAVRKALGDDGDRQNFIRTVRGLGHRFVAPVRIRPAETAAACPTPQAQDTVVTGSRGEKPTVAVLPFGRVGLPSGFAMLGDAMPADIISSLSRLRWLRVIARQSTFRFRNDDVDLAGLRSVLGASYCLSGRVELFGKQLSVSVELVDTRSGATIWAERFERPFSDVHLIRHETVGAVIGALDLQITQTEAALARVKPVENLDAWEAYHLGLSHAYRFNARDNAIASGLFRRATELAPGFSTAYAAQAFTSHQDVVMGYAPDRQVAVAAVRHATERCIALDPLDPYGNEAMGRLQLLTGNLDDGLVWLDRSVELSPNYARAHYSRGYLQVLRCHTTESRQGLDMAMRLSPLDPMLPPMRFMKSMALGIDGDYAGAADLGVLAARTGGSHVGGLLSAVAMCQLAGREAEAKHWAQVLRELRPDITIGLFMNSMPFVDADFRQILRAALQVHGVAD